MVKEEINLSVNDRQIIVEPLSLLVDPDDRIIVSYEIFCFQNSGSPCLWQL